MAQFSIIDEIKKKKQEVRELSATISVYAMAPVTRMVKAKEEELKDRLRYQLLELELEGLKTKIKFMKRLIEILTNKKSN